MTMTAEFAIRCGGNATTIQQAAETAQALMDAMPAANGCTSRVLVLDEQGWPIGSRFVPFRFNRFAGIARVDHDAIDAANGTVVPVSVR